MQLTRIDTPFKAATFYNRCARISGNPKFTMYDYVDRCIRAQRMTKDGRVNPHVLEFVLLKGTYLIENYYRKEVKELRSILFN